MSACVMIKAAQSHVGDLDLAVIPATDLAGIAVASGAVGCIFVGDICVRGLLWDALATLQQVWVGTGQLEHH